MHWATHIQKQNKPLNHNVGKGWGINQQATQVNEKDIMFHVLEAIRIRDMKFFRDQDEKDEYDAIKNDKRAMMYYLSARVKPKDVSNILDVWDLNNIGSNVNAITLQNRKNKAKDMEHMVRFSRLNAMNLRTIGALPWVDREASSIRDTLKQGKDSLRRDFRVANYKMKYLRHDDGKFFNYTKLNCCSKFLLAYFWFLKYVKQTSRVKTHAGEKFTFADLGFPPRAVFYNHGYIWRALGKEEEGKHLDDKISKGDCERLASALKSILNDGHLQRELHIKNMVVTLIEFWDNSKGNPSCDFYELMDDLNLITDDMKLMQKKQMQQYMTNTMFGPAGGNA